MGYWQRPATSLDPRFWCYITRRFGSFGGQSRSSLAAGIFARLLLEISLCVRSFSLWVELIELLKGALLQLSSQHTTSVNFYILLSLYYYNKPAFSTPRSCDCKSWISILKCLARAWTSIPLEPAARSIPAYLTSNILLRIQQARCGPAGSRRSSLPDFHDIRHMKVVKSSASRTGRFCPQECSWYLYSLGAESTPGPWCGRKEYVTEKFSDTTWNQSRNRPTSSAAP